MSLYILTITIDTPGRKPIRVKAHIEAASRDEALEQLDAEWFHRMAGGDGSATVTLHEVPQVRTMGRQVLA